MKLNTEYDNILKANLSQRVSELGRAIKSATEDLLPCAVGETVYTIKNGRVELTYFDTNEEIMKAAKAFGVKLFLDEKEAMEKLAELKGTSNNEGDSTMGLFERGYKAAATADLERSIRELEERNKIAMQKTNIAEETAEIRNNLNFAERLNLISAAQAEQYRERLELLRELQRKQNEKVVDSIENPRERAARYQSLDSYNSRISQERANVSAEKDASVARVTAREDIERTH